MTEQNFKPTLPNPALYTDENHNIYLADSPPLVCGPADCVVHVRCNGICGYRSHLKELQNLKPSIDISHSSDVHFWQHGGIGHLNVTCPYVLGHEGAGVIALVGEQVKNFRIGDRVAIEPGVPCGECLRCSKGEYNLCGAVEFSGAPPVHGSIRRYHVHPAKYLHKMPDALGFAEGALLEPLSVVMHGFEQSPVRLG